MFNELIDKLKVIKKLLQSSNNKTNEVQKNFEITVSKENNVFKMEISDYISITDYFETMKLGDGFNLSDFISNNVLWNSNKQKVNKGIYYVIINNNCLYNILINDEILRVDEKIKKDDITEEKIITFNLNSNEYRYSSFNGSTFYTRYYNKNRLFSLGKLELSLEEVYEEISLIISNLKSISGIAGIFDIELLENYILRDLNEDLFRIKNMK